MAVVVQLETLLYKDGSLYKDGGSTGCCAPGHKLQGHGQHKKTSGSFVGPRRKLDGSRGGKIACHLK